MKTEQQPRPTMKEKFSNVISKVGTALIAIGAIFLSIQVLGKVGRFFKTAPKAAI